MQGGHAGRGRSGPLGSGEQAQVDLDLVLPPGPGTSGTATAGGAAGAGAAGGSGTRGGKRSGETGAPPSFLDKLCTILGEPRLSEHVSWNQEGDGIVINQPEQFAKVVLPKYYKHSNYQSFVRQLNIYGFHKTRHDEDSCEFKQPNFKRGVPHLVGLIRRKGQSSKSASAAGGSRQAESTPSRKMAAEEAKGMVDRVTAELRAVCNRVVHLEAEMGMINHRHNHLRIECQALLKVVLLEGGQALAERAVATLRQLPHVAAEAEMSELLSSRPRPEEEHQPYHLQRQQHQHQRVSGPSQPPFQGSTSASTRRGLVAAGGDAGLSPAGGRAARSGEEGANPSFSASGAALASVVAAAIASHPPHPHAPPGFADRGDAPGNDPDQVRLDEVGQAAAAAASPPLGGFPLAFWPEAVEPRDSSSSVSRAGGDVGGGGDSEGACPVSLASRGGGGGESMEQVQAWHAGVVEGTGGEQGVGLENGARNKRKAAGAVD